MSRSRDELREELGKSLDEAEWSWLVPHHKRGALIWVSQELDLLIVGECVASDAKADVESWLKQGLLSRPSAAQVEAWEKSPQRKFLSLIVQPWVLVQERLLH